MKNNTKILIFLVVIIVLVIVSIFYFKSETKPAKIQEKENQESEPPEEIIEGYMKDIINEKEKFCPNFESSYDRSFCLISYYLFEAITDKDFDCNSPKYMALFFAEGSGIFKQDNNIDGLRQGCNWMLNKRFADCDTDLSEFSQISCSMLNDLEKEENPPFDNVRFILNALIKKDTGFCDMFDFYSDQSKLLPGSYSKINLTSIDTETFYIQTCRKMVAES